MSIASNFPTISPTLNLSFALTKQLDPRITFTRASEGRYYDGKTFSKAEENLLLQSQEFSASAGIVSTANTTAAPDGTTTADTLAEDSGTSLHYSEKGFSSSGTIALSVFAKLGSGTRFLTLSLSKDASNFGSATFDLSIGSNTQTQAVGTYSAATASIVAVAQNYYRCTLTVTTDTSTIVRFALNNTGTPSASNRGLGATYTGDGTSSLILWGAQLEQRSSVTAYTPTTTQPITNYIPVLMTAANGVARFDHNPVTEESLGLLIEEQRTNLVTYSEQFDNAAWAKTNLAVVANAVVSPDGTLTGDKFIVDNATPFGSGFTRQTVTKAASAIQYTSSVYAKAGEFNRLQVLVRDASSSSNRANVTVSLIDGAIVTAASSIGTFTGASVSVASVGNGWFRIALTFTTGTETAIWGGTYLPYDSVATQGNGYSGVYIWGAQLEAGAFATSYIPTVAAQVTRSADAASMTGTNFSSWYRQDEGTLYGEVATAAPAVAGASRRIANINNGTENERISISYAGASGIAAAFITSGAVAQAQFSSPSGAYSLPTKVAMAYKFNDVSASVNGSSFTTDTAAIIPVVDRLTIGDVVTGGSGPQNINGTIRKIAFYPARVTNAQLQALTS